MKLSWDEAKRRATLEQRGLEFADATEAFGRLEYIIEDNRRDYGERRYISVGYIRARLCVLVWTPRDGGRHIISMRKANAREQERYKAWTESRR
ncbi:MAG: BrnT family toxin [Rhizobiales bacterium]|nr:BrnT family toxin [Hyphomicrobiales bacterium]